MRIKLTYEDSQEVLHKLGILESEPELQEQYGITQAQASALVRSVPHKGGEWDLGEAVEIMNAVRGEMSDHAVVLRNIAETARRDNATGQSLRIHKQAKKFEGLFAEVPAPFERCDWPFSSEQAKTCSCYRLKIRGGFIYLRANDPHFSYTVSCGANSGRSFTGCFFGNAEIKTSYDAAQELIKRNNAGKFD